MRAELIEALRARRADIRGRWADLLRAHRANTPLANPEALVHLLDWTLGDFLAALAHRPCARRPRSSATLQTACPCQQNPLLVYFTVGRQAVQEALIHAQAALPSLDPLERDASLEEINLVLSAIAVREIRTLCGVCRQRTEAKADRASPHATTGCAGK